MYNHFEINDIETKAILNNNSLSLNSTIISRTTDAPIFLNKNPAKLSFYLTNVSDESELINNELPKFTAYINGRSLTVLCDSGAQITAALASIFEDENKDNRTSCTREIRAANHAIFETAGALKNLTLDVFPSFKIQLQDIPLLTKLPVDLILGYPDLCKLGFSIPRGNTSFFYLENKRIKKNQADYRILRVPKKTNINPSFFNSISIRNPYFNISKEKELLISPIPSLSITNKLVVNAAVVANTEMININVSTDRSDQFTISKQLALARVEPLTSDCHIQSLITSENMEAELSKAKLFQAERATRFNITSTSMPKIAEIGDLSKVERDQLDKLILSNNLAFTYGPLDLGKIFGYKFGIELKDPNKICYIPPRAIPPGIRSEAEKEFQTWKLRDMCVESNSQHNSPVIVIRKGESKSIRLVIDSRQLNANMLVEKTPIPHASSILYNLGTKIASGNTFFLSRLDLSRAYSQLQIDERDQHYGAFSFEGRSWQPTRMTYGYSSAPASWHRLIRNIFDGLQIEIFFDDFVLVTKTFSDHIKILDEIFKRAIKFGILIDPKKCHFCTQDTEVLGVRINKKGLFPSTRHTVAVEQYPCPSNKKQTKMFLGLAGFISRHIPKSSQILNPLYNLTSSKTPFIWTDIHNQAFLEFKKMVSTAPGLCHRNENLPLFVVSDAGGTKISGILYQKTENDIFEPLSYFSRMLTVAERRTGSRTREIYALSDSIKAFEFWLYGVTFTVITDHYSLRWLLTSYKSNDLSARLLNILAYLHRYDFSIVFMKNTSEPIIATDALTKSFTMDDLNSEPQPTKIEDLICSLVLSPVVSHVNGDEKARYALRENVRKSDSDKIYEPDFTPDPNIAFQFSNSVFSKTEMIKYQSEDEFCVKIMAILSKSGKRSPFCRKTRKKFCIKNDLLFSLKCKRYVLVLPTNIAFDFISYYHQLQLHPGAKALESMLTSTVHIHALQRICQQVTAMCENCLRNKVRKSIRPQKVINRSFSQYPFQRTYIDLVQFKPDINKKTYLLTFTDELSGYIDGEPICSKRDGVVAQALTSLILRNGAFGCLIMDRGSELFGPILKGVCKQLNI